MKYRYDKAKSFNIGKDWADKVNREDYAKLLWVNFDKLVGAAMVTKGEKMLKKLGWHKEMSYMGTYIYVNNKKGWFLKITKEPKSWKLTTKDGDAFEFKWYNFLQKRAIIKRVREVFSID